MNIFARVFADIDTVPPVCVGLFGDWGSGKSSFMLQMEKDINRLAKDNNGGNREYCKNIVQIRFNAWHYVDTSLYASLVSHIFEELDKHLNEENEEETRKKINEGRQLAETLRKEAKKNLDDAEDDLRNLTKTLADKRGEASTAGLTFNTAFAALKGSEVGDNLLKALREGGYSECINGTQELINLSKEINSTSGRLRSLLLSMTSSLGKLKWTWIIVTTLIVGASPLLGGWFSHLLGLTTDFAKAVGSVMALIIPSVPLLLGGLKKASETITKIEKAYTAMMEEVSSPATELGKQLQAANEEVISAQNRLKFAQESYEAAARRVEEARTEHALINRLPKDPALMGRFIRERLASKDYEKHLGIISLIRKDLEQLSEYLAPENKKTEAPVERIILYIDDLDRCPADRVVEVLQAVHLFLTFRLFVVVVAVDPRWLHHSLESQYPMLKKRRSRSGDFTPLPDERMSTPQDYLEKIFQIPFHLPQMAATDTERLIDDIFKIASDIAGKVEVKTATATITAQGTSSPGPTSANPDDETQVAPAAANTAIGEKAPSSSSPGATSISPTQKNEEKPAEPAQNLHLETWEIERVKKIAFFIPTPRALKRFAILYRLLRVSLTREDGASKVFLGTKEEPGDYLEVMILLAVLTGFPELAPRFMAELNASYNLGVSFGDFVDALNPKRGKPTKSKTQEQICTLGCHNKPVMGNEIPQWERLCKLLKSPAVIDPANSLRPDMKRLNNHSREVARYSYRDCNLNEFSDVPSA